MIVVDITSKANRIHDFDHAGVNENAADNQTDDAIKDVAPERIHFSKANIERRTPNFEHRMQQHDFPVRRSAFGVFFIFLSSPIVPSRPRGRTRSFFLGYLLAALLHEAVAQPLRMRCNFVRYSKQLLSCRATIARGIGATIRSNCLHSIESRPEYDRARIPQPAGHPPTSRYRPTFALDRR
jgi:hypothetical protein